MPAAHLPRTCSVPAAYLPRACPAQAAGSPEAFAVIMSAIVSAIDVYGDLMRMAIASPGNDFRL